MVSYVQLCVRCLLEAKVVSKARENGEGNREVDFPEDFELTV